MERKRNVPKKPLRHAQSRKPGTRRKPKVKMEDPAIKEIGFKESKYRSPGGVLPMSVYKSPTTGRYYSEGDMQLSSMTRYITRIGKTLELGAPQITSAIYLYQKFRKVEPKTIGNLDTAARVFLLLAGRQQGLSQRSSRFMNVGKAKLFNKYLLDIGGKLDVRSRQPSEVETMATVNEVAVQLSYPPVSKSTTHEAIRSLGGSPRKDLPMWVFAYHVTRNQKKWSRKALGMKKDVAKAFGVGMNVVTRSFYIASHTKTGKRAPSWIQLQQKEKE